jgi:hypothetical protein
MSFRGCCNKTSRMELLFVCFLSLLAASSSFQPLSWKSSRFHIQLFTSTAENEATATSFDFDDLVKSTFPGAIANPNLQESVVSVLTEKGYSPQNTLLATSLCCDELARRLEDVFVDVYGQNFNLGGLSGFPFAGNTGFGAMAAHIPDDGFCLIVYGPHVGIAQDGTVGKVERNGIALLDTCCGSAVAASNYLESITKGGFPVSTDMRKFTDFQQGAVQKMILPYGQRLANAENRMVELPYALYEIQDMLMQSIVKGGISGTKKGVTLLGGIQINTGPDAPDYFHPLRFDYMNNEGEVLEEMLSKMVFVSNDDNDSHQNGFRQFLEDPVVLVNGDDKDDEAYDAPESIDQAFFVDPKTSKRRQKKQQANGEQAKLVAEADAKVNAEYERLADSARQQQEALGAKPAVKVPPPPPAAVAEKKITVEEAAEIVAKEEAKELAKDQAEAAAKLAAEEQAKAAEEAAAKLAAEEQADAEEEAAAKLAAEVQAKAEEEAAAKLATEEQAKAEEEAAAKLAAEEQAKAEEEQQEATEPAAETEAVETEEPNREWPGQAEVVVGGVFPQSRSSFGQSNIWWENPRGGIGQGSTYGIADDWLGERPANQEPGTSWYDGTR